ncbi:uncharacterized protein BJ212DRAFT_1304397 [Suillus subaureus]|uniref:Uncharacterized protein n=1 Tax=Suillus subaureus TaxID=48587 RepID=A0A9P7J5W8_9AGAM|nr:uncharacterized protein BJ212DRAFT_1304397 [Suillus subaureus]KAG1804188.1 hypothetical protein BJ212DRAFT_1304397 [Suillus subaureus]
MAMFLDDTALTQKLMQAGTGATLLIHEATTTHNQVDMTCAKMHSTFGQAINGANGAVLAPPMSLLDIGCLETLYQESSEHETQYSQSQQFAEWINTYGPIISLRVGPGRVMVIIGRY